MRRRLLVATATGTALAAMLLATPADAKPTEAEFIHGLLKGHNSPITGKMVLDAVQWYGAFTPKQFLVIIGAETSMGDPKLGGAPARHNNFGCMKARANYQATKWGCLASGTFQTQGGTWLAFPDAQTGVIAMGRLLKVGPSGNPGDYRAMLAKGDWAAFARVYYGANVAGLNTYIANLKAIDASLTKRAKTAGIVW